VASWNKLDILDLMIKALIELEKTLNTLLECLDGVTIG